MYFIQTTDVELTSIPLNKPVPEMAEKVLKIGLPRVLDLYSRYDVEGTFFFTGKIVEIEPEVVDIVKERGHEIGCHGYTHYSTEGFDTMPYDKQVEYLLKSKKIIENVSGRIESFRSPEARISNLTIRALEETNFKYDSSVCPQRIDGPFSYGFKNKFKWIFCVRRPYRMSYKSFISEGMSKIIEFPVSSFTFPFIGTTMRVSPKINSILKKFLFFEASKRNIPVVFLFHPNECIENRYNPIIANKKSDRLISDQFKTKLKMRNLGLNAIKLMEKIFKYALEKDVEFLCIKRYAKEGFNG